MRNPLKGIAERRKSFKRGYLTRGQAARKLQISNKDFQRLCIIKGIYPRQPKNFPDPGKKNRMYYFTRDINWLLTEPNLETVRQFKSYKKKLAKNVGRQEYYGAKQTIRKKKPEISLPRIVKERYPTFAEALRDIDDALCHVHLYSILPPTLKSTSLVDGHHKLTTGQSKKCKKLVTQWREFVVKSGCLRKAFISIKGYYYQAELQGETITWVVPFEFANKRPKTINYTAMIAFLDFYVVYLGFVLFKLEADYEQKLKAEAVEGDPDAQQQDEHTADFPLTAEQQQAKNTKNKITNLFSDFVFCLGRETPSKHLDMIIRACGGTVVKDRTLSSITHEVVDRPKPLSMIDGRDYVQPQWIWDSLNAKKILIAEPYGPGKQLPAHLSPFGDKRLGDKDVILYDATNPLRAPGEDADQDGQADNKSEDTDSNASEQRETEIGDNVYLQSSDEEDMYDNDDDDDDDDQEESKEDAATAKKAKRLEKEKQKREQHMEKQEKEKAGKNSKKLTKQQAEDIKKKERIQMLLPMASAKKRKLYDYVKKNEAYRDKKIAQLDTKRQKLAQGDVVVKSRVSKGGSTQVFLADPNKATLPPKKKGKGKKKGKKSQAKKKE
eukprot:TRINITY_DN66990_c5_g5_i1.p1 TRINITY_DN66990_c5_g5~~TRINITY_DN66990_c5_g5_i1.p1  ORF type:complete len:620 (-),score=115.25 TRINITY_DN66990_c5_g5_i1:1863-3689(-)